jgi:hypothetical protein
VRSCDEETCFLDRERIDLSSIARIELQPAAVPSAVPPNSVLTTDNSIVLRFSGLNAGYVYAGDREIDRQDVAIIFIVPPPAAEPESHAPPIVQPGRPADAATAPAPAPPPPSSPAPMPQPAPAPAPARPASSAPPAAGVTWSGRMRGVAWGNVDGCRARLTIDVMVRLRESQVRPLFGADGTVMGTGTDLDPTGSTVTNRYTSVCTGGRASGRGTITIAGNVTGGVIYHNTTRTTRRLPVYDLALQPGQAWYTFTVGQSDNPEHDVTYTHEGGSSVAQHGFITPLAGGAPLVPPSPMGDPTARFVEGGRMSGAYVTGATGVFERLAASWSVCRAGVRCSRMPPLPDEAQQQRCPQEALAELCGDQLVALVEELEPLQGEYADLMKQADSYYADYVSALRRCVAWRAVQTILETILGAQTARLGQAGENAKTALDLFKALIEGNPAGPLGDALMGDAEAAFYPLELANQVKGYLEQGNQIGSILAQSGDVNALRGVAVEACLGSVSPELHMRAQKFVDYTRQAAEFYRDVYAPKMNDLDAKMRECADRDTAAAQACR